MNTDVEDLLRHTLTTQGQGVPADPDPYTRFAERERIHRRNRRVAFTSLASVVLVAVALVQTGTVTLPDRDGNSSTNLTPSAPSGLLAMPVRGSLAEDKAWQDEFRQNVDSVKVFSGQVEGSKLDLIPGNNDKVDVDPERSRVLYAGDVSERHRVALLALPFRPTTGSERMGFVWFVGRAGAAPDEMRQDQSGGYQIYGFDSLGDVAYWPSTNQIETVPSEVVLVLGPRGAKIESAPRPRYLAEGRVDRPWTEVSSADGSAVIRATEPGSDGRVPYQARVTLDGKLLHPGILFSGVYADQKFSDEDLEAATAATRGGPVEKEWLRQVLPMVLVNAELDGQPDVELRVPWVGKVEGSDAAVFTLQPRGGGVLVYAVRWTTTGDHSSGHTDLRLLLPAEGAHERPIVWRPVVDPQYADVDPLLINVVAPVGAARVVVEAGGKTTELNLDGAGRGTVWLPAEAEGVVRALDEGGKLLGEMPLRPLEQDPDLNEFGMYALPGESERTRIVK